MTISLTNEQSNALKTIKEWYESDSTAFKLSGLAGTGKSTLIPYIAEELDNGGGNVKFVTPTNKACVVLRDKLGAEYRPYVSTIHKYMYRLAGNHCVRCPIRHKPGCTGDTCTCGSHRDTSAICHGFIGKNNCGCVLEFIPDRNVQGDNPKWVDKLIIVDEASMVSSRIYEDIITLCRMFELKVLFVGDHGQLPPVEDKGNFFLMQEPDFILHEIQRQAADSAIIKVAYEARQGRLIPFGTYGDEVVKLNKDHDLDIKVDTDTLAITYFVNERSDNELTTGQLNQIWRFNLGHSGEPKVGEKAICLRTVRTVNEEVIPKGIRGTILSIGDGYDDFSNRCYNLVVELDDGTKHRAKASIKQFADAKLVSERNRQERWAYGYAITGHQAQGSEFDSVVVFEPGVGFQNKIGRDYYAKWLYTSITRAKEKLTLVM